MGTRCIEKKNNIFKSTVKIVGALVFTPMCHKAIKRSFSVSIAICFAVKLTAVLSDVGDQLAFLRTQRRCVQQNVFPVM